jgi:hypothetical protein
MKNVVLSPPKFGFIVATRAALAAGIGLLVSQRLSEAHLRRVGTTLVAVGVLATIPAALFLAQGRKRPSA